MLVAQKELEAAVEEGHVAGHEVEQARAALMAATRPAQVPARVSPCAPIAGRVLKVAQASEGPVALGAPLVELGDTARLEVVAELLTADALRARRAARCASSAGAATACSKGACALVEPAAFTKVSALGVEEQRVRVLIDLVSPAQRWASLGDGFPRRRAHRHPLAAQGAEGAGQRGVPRPRAATRCSWSRAAARGCRCSWARNGQEAWIESGLAAGAQVIVCFVQRPRTGSE